MQAELLNTFGDDLMVVNTARVSFNKHHIELTDNDVNLIDYLATQGHWSPFSHPKIQFRIELPIFVARQWEKHRIGAVRGYDIYDQNEVSRRYVTDAPSFYDPQEWRARPDGSIKQGSGDVIDRDSTIAAYQIYEDLLAHSNTAYRSLLALNICPEQARMVLPVSHYTSWIETGSLLYWSRVCRLRLCPHAQLEIRLLAEQVAEQAQAQFPISWAALSFAGAT